MASEFPTGFLTLRAGTFQRISRATRGEDVVRHIEISNCPVTNWTAMSDDMDGKLDGHSFDKDQWLSVSIRPEKLWKEDSVGKMGGLNTEHLLAWAYLPPDAFDHFWRAAEAADGSTRSIELQLMPYSENVLSVTNVSLIESMPAPPLDSASTSLPGSFGVEGRLHPVVAELRDMRQQLRGATKSIVIALCIFAAVWLLFRIFR